MKKIAMLLLTLAFALPCGSAWAALTQTEVSQLFVSVFGRASEGDGNTYWQTDQANMTTTADVMLTTSAASDYFGATLADNQSFIEFIYENTLNKTITDDSDGIAYWVAELTGGKSKGEVVTALINAVYTYSDSIDATTLAAYNQFINRVEVSNYCAETIQVFTNDYTQFIAYITSVNDTAASVTSSIASVLADVVTVTATGTWSGTWYSC